VSTVTPGPLLRLAPKSVRCSICQYPQTSSTRICGPHLRRDRTVFGISGQQCAPVLSSTFSEQTCAKCGAGEYSGFRDSTSEQVRALGFRPADYC
jgi:hypothetical protein